ncbi:zona pellucida-like domain-containing protein 1 [Takifugu flavidus]|uniref:Zona pellucida-like domain-containing protein 1 n=1 Tax=Takifugu flavidus TaxID=433684 RepID=A0A5C6P3D9_9TELE|nr:zona pellucida-like domain-containing protein 1 [Takifugu flavidus]XP_056911579.1 zona pellucida-like domain-containing protein 1 [Takifugu flavidus]TWW74272.1 Zona pellucida-like domain-containing protein 1 [Takifugu flavidus]
MWQILLVCQLAATFLPARGQNDCIGHSTFRSPVNSDIQVSCGPEMVHLQILLCPIYFNGYNESLVSLNSQHSKQQCKGTADWNADPPVVKFNFSITEEAITVCSNTMTVTEEEGTGVFADFSSVQYVSISGMVCSKDPSTGTITYHEEVMYLFSCHYPLQYLINNTQMSVSGANLAVNDNNGSFISTLSMQLYNDNSYSSIMTIPPQGLELKTRIFVEVKASNLTNRFNVHLDRCYATASPFPINTSFYDLFVGCNLDGQTVIGVNGDKQVARFSFEAFRFIHSTEATFSTYYVHCATRLCMSDFCTSLSQNCSTGTNNRRRRRRSDSDSQDTTVSDMATVSSTPINVRLDRGAAQTEVTSSVVVVSVVAAIVGAICFTLVAFIVFHVKKNKTLFS